MLDPEKKIAYSKTVYIIFVAHFLIMKTFNKSGALEFAKIRYPELALPGCIVISFVIRSEATSVHLNYLLRRTKLSTSSIFLRRTMIDRLLK